jgi:hypothetical protein
MFARIRTRYGDAKGTESGHQPGRSKIRLLKAPAEKK